jgi:hypothetical protein
VLKLSDGDRNCRRSGRGVVGVTTVHRGDAIGVWTTAAPSATARDDRRDARKEQQAREGISVPFLGLQTL